MIAPAYGQCCRSAAGGMRVLAPRMRMQSTRLGLARRCTGKCLGQSFLDRLKEEISLLFQTTDKRSHRSQRCAALEIAPKPQPICRNAESRLNHISNQGKVGPRVALRLRK